MICAREKAQRCTEDTFYEGQKEHKRGSIIYRDKFDFGQETEIFPVVRTPILFRIKTVPRLRLQGCCREVMKADHLSLKGPVSTATTGKSSRLEAWIEVS